MSLWLISWGGDNTENYDIIWASDYDDAVKEAYDSAIELIGDYGGLHGFPDPDDDDFEQECESWIEYEAELFDPEKHAEIVRDFDLTIPKPQ